MVFPLKIPSLESIPSLTERREAEMSPDKNRCLYHIHNLCCNFSFLQTERIYFQVFLPKGSKEKSKPMFFSHRWSIGKAVDFAAAVASLKNDNNKLAAKVTTHYCSFSLQGLGCLCITMWFISLFTEIKAVSRDFRTGLTLGSHVGKLDD